MKWQDTAFILSRRAFGEKNHLIHVLSASHGRASGFVKYSNSRAHKSLLQIGNYVDVEWMARLPEHLGHFICKPIRAHASFIMQAGYLPLIALSVSAEILENILPENEPVPEIFADFKILVENLNSDAWLAHYCRWEVNLLAHLGFGLDLQQCAVTAGHDNLCYISPKSGRAVSDAGAKGYEDKLLPFPKLYRSDHPHPLKISTDDAKESLAVSGYFLNKWVLNPFKKELPSNRVKLCQ